MSDVDLSGRTAVVTGAARGIGAALAVRLAQSGGRVALVGLEPAALAATAAACGPHAEARAWTADVTDRAAMATVAAQVSAHFGRVDIVVANAGVALGGPFDQSDPDTFDRVIEVNLLGSIITARAFLPALVASGGYLLQVASLAALIPAPFMAAYCTSKSGVEAFAHVLAVEVGHQGVGVGVAYLSWTDTDMVRSADADHALGQLRAGLPWPANRTAPLAPAVERLLRGIARRSPHVYGQPWLRALQWLPRGALPAAVARFGGRQMAAVAPVVAASAEVRRDLIGPGGQAAARQVTAARRPEHPAPS